MNELIAEVAVRKSDKVMFHVIGMKDGLVQLYGQDGNKYSGETKDFNFYTYVGSKRVYVD